MSENEQDITPEVLGALAGYGLSLNDVNAIKKWGDDNHVGVKGAIGMALQQFALECGSDEQEDEDAVASIADWKEASEHLSFTDRTDYKLLKALFLYAGLTGETLQGLCSSEDSANSSVANAVKHYVEERQKRLEEVVG